MRLVLCPSCNQVRAKLKKVTQRCKVYHCIHCGYQFDRKEKFSGKKEW